MVQDPHVGVAGAEPGHDVNKSIVLNVDAGGDLFEVLELERPLAALVEPVDVGRSGLSR